MVSKTLLSLALIVVTLPLAGCSQPKRCTERTASSFTTFLDDEWTTYCQEYTAHIEAPSDYSMVELTKFFADHPQRVEDLQKTLYRFEKYETCFKNPKEELQLRELQSCLKNDDETDLQIKNAWTARINPWIEENNFKVDAVDPKLVEVEQESKRLIKKANEAFNFKAPMEKPPYEVYAAQVAEVDSMLRKLEGIEKEYNQLAKLAAKHETLALFVTEQIDPKMNAMISEISELRKRWSDVETARKFVEFAVYSAGVKCPRGERKARQELRTAKKMLSGKNKQVGGSGVRISSKTTSETKGEIDFERFEGFVCGVRSDPNQFKTMPQLCAQYQFVIERQKPSGERSWEDWTLKSFEEAGPGGGVDCSLKK